MNFVVRTDASLEIGSGHVIRCLTLADALKLRNSNVIFVSRSLPDDLSQEISRRGHSLHSLNGPADQVSDARETWEVIFKNEAHPSWIIVDHYGLDSRWETEIRSLSRAKLAVIDDLANRQHNCDLILDQNFHANAQTRYQKLIPSSSETLFGPRYALLRPEFYNERQNLNPRTGKVEKLLIFFGGADATGETLKALRALIGMKPTFSTDVIIGKMNPRRPEIQNLVKELSSVRLHVGVSNMAEMMNQADLSLGAGGTTSWERCFLGLPSLVVQVAENQVELTKSLAEEGIVRDIGFFNTIDEIRLAQELNWAITHPTSLLQMSVKALQLIGEPPSSGSPEVVKRLMQ